MKNLYALSMLATALLGSLSSCQKADVTPSEPVSCTYQVLNSKGEETTVFAQGQEIFFRYTITNHTDQDIDLENDVYDHGRFMEVFEEKDGQLRLLGKPYATIAHTYNGFYPVAPHGSLTYTLSWVESAPSQDVGFYTAASNSPLPPGIYRTSMLPRLIWNHPYGPQTTVPVVAQDFVRRFEVR